MNPVTSSRRQRDTRQGPWWDGARHCCCRCPWRRWATSGNSSRPISIALAQIGCVLSAFAAGTMLARGLAGRDPAARRN
ncbi:hypothetical protein ACFQX6_08590 [Streptosporangium lutulentum]